MSPADSGSRTRPPGTVATTSPSVGGSRLSGGGVAGNERLTAAGGVMLIVLLAALGVTIVRIHPLIDEHLFIGLLLLGPVALKLASTGYRFARYYTRDPVYRERGAPPLALRVLGPAVVATTLAVFATGIALLAEGRAASGTLRELHKLSFILWAAATGVHVLGHLPDLSATFLMRRRDRYELNRLAAGGLGRSLALIGAIVAGAVLAVVLIPQFASWSHFASFHHDH
ncbi:MAG TPA: hypothetical protein VMS02_04565 [Solirubrobacteraceae bacterium]|nr:hypothetical protein [Solirubrobacteraceae bacterium]